MPSGSRGGLPLLPFYNDHSVSTTITPTEISNLINTSMSNLSTSGAGQVRGQWFNHRSNYCFSSHYLSNVTGVSAENIDNIYFEISVDYDFTGFSSHLSNIISSLDSQSASDFSFYVSSVLNAESTSAANGFGFSVKFSGIKNSMTYSANMPVFFMFDPIQMDTSGSNTYGFLLNRINDTIQVFKNGVEVSVSKVSEFTSTLSSCEYTTVATDINPFFGVNVNAIVMDVVNNYWGTNRETIVDSFLSYFTSHCAVVSLKTKQENMKYIVPNGYVSLAASQNVTACSF